jgi:hypothetical protein
VKWSVRSIMHVVLNMRGTIRVIGGFARPDGRILVKRMLTETG